MLCKQKIQTKQDIFITMKQIIFTLLSCFLLAQLPVNAQQEISLYPKGAKTDNLLDKEEQYEGEDFITYISKARMYAYPAPKEKATGAAVLICPGGGYWGLAAQKEGTELAEWLNQKGISAFVLYYRMPNQHDEIPLEDAKTAMNIIRTHAREWNIDKKKIGIAGFSAGGHLASTLGTHFTARTRPDFMILLYPVITMTGYTHQGSKQNLLGTNPTDEKVHYYSNETQVKAETPAAFIVHAKDDKVVDIENSYLFYNALTKKNIPAEIHIYEQGGHGFGLRKTGYDSEKWPEELEKWLQKLGLAANVNQ